MPWKGWDGRRANTVSHAHWSCSMQCLLHTLSGSHPEVTCLRTDLTWRCVCIFGALCAEGSFLSPGCLISAGGKVVLLFWPFLLVLLWIIIPPRKRNVGATFVCPEHILFSAHLHYLTPATYSMSFFPLDSDWSGFENWVLSARYLVSKFYHLQN